MPGSILSTPLSSPRSGPEFEKCSIQHRSEILLSEQVQNVKNTQASLTKTLQDIDVCKDIDQLNQLYVNAQSLKDKSEQELLKLQVLHKINHELRIARKDLHLALQGYGKREACRKRVSWLERRIEGIMGRSPSEKQLRDESKDLLAIDLPEEFNTVTLCNPVIDEKWFISSSAINNEEKFNYNNQTYDYENFNNHHSERDNTDEDHNKLRDSVMRSIFVTDSIMLNYPVKERDDNQSRTVTTAMVDKPTVVHRATKSAPVMEGQMQDSGSVVDKNTIAQPRSAINVEHMRTSTSKKSVKIQSPKSDKSADIGHESTGSLQLIPAETALDILEEPSDLALDYWNTEHHRYKIASSSRFIAQVDPLSYHQMSLSVPGSFLTNERICPKSLPWTQTDSQYDIPDIHKHELDKLALRICDISNKVHDATDYSLMSNVRKKLTSEGSHAKSTDSISAADSVHQPSVTYEGSDITLPKLDGKRLGSSHSGRLVYYPNPVPQSPTLPLTRLNRNKTYPRSPSTFCNTDSPDRSVVVRIVNQRNLYGETKLTLYEDKNAVPEDNVKSTEVRLRQLLNEDRSGKSRISSVSTQKTKAHFTAARALSRMKGDVKIAQNLPKWSEIKPKSNTLDHSGKKWERVKTLVHVNLASDRIEERQDAARNLGLLRCGDAMVTYALKQRLLNDTDDKVKFEAAKSLILIGCWDEEVLEVMVQFLGNADPQVQKNIIDTMIEGRNIQYVDKSTDVFTELVNKLSELSGGTDDLISFNAAVLVAKLCVLDKTAKERLLTALKTSSDTHVKSKAVEVLVKYMNHTDTDILSHIFDQLHNSTVWKYRALAAKLLILLGKDIVCSSNSEKYVFDQLEKQLWDEPIAAVRFAVAKAITALNMLPRAVKLIEKKLESSNESSRAEAVTSLGTLGMRNEKFTRTLLEMLDLDSSENVRIMIIRTFATLELSDKRVIRILKEKEKMDGPLAKEAQRTLKVLTSSSTASS